MHELLVGLLVIANMTSMLHLGAFIVGANVYDIKQFRTSRRQKAPAAKRQPLISVIVPAHNEAVVITRTLDSIRSSSYKNIEIIVVDDGSTDATSKVVRNYITRMRVLERRRQTILKRAVQRFATGKSRRTVPPGRPVLYATTKGHRRYLEPELPVLRIKHIYQKNAGKAAAMNNAIANHAKGTLVMCLDADSMLHPLAIERAVVYFKDRKIIGVAANVRVMQSRSIVSTVQRFEHMIGYRSKKFYTLTNSEFIVGGVASTYRRSALKKVGYYDTDTMTEDIGLSMKLVAQAGNRNKRIVYAADVVAMTEGVKSFNQLLRQRYRWKMGSLQNLFKYRSLIGRGEAGKHSRMLTHYRLPMAILSEILLVLEPVLVGYIVYLSFAHHTPSILLGAYVTITGYVLLTLWPDEHLSLREKLELSVVALGIYICFYIMDVVQVVAIFRCLKQYKRIALGSQDATWVSPTRLGQAASF